MSLLRKTEVVKYQIDTTQIGEGDIIQFRSMYYEGQPIRAIVLDSCPDFIMVFTQKWNEVEIRAEDFLKMSVFKLEVSEMIG